MKIKKVISIILSIVIVTIFSVITASAVEYAMGDVNTDGAVDAIDASIVLTHYASIQTKAVGILSEDQSVLADINGDNQIDALDASGIISIYAKKQVSEDIQDNDSKVLIAYYSASGTTERIADLIAEEMNADIFVITPVDEYTDADLNWTDFNSRVVKEHNDPDNRHVELIQTVPDNFDSYDNIFIGYPIWWQEAAWVVDDFVTKNDFTGKNVIPFCTSMSSPLGESGTKLAAMAGTGNWLEGMRFTSNSSEEDVKEWARGLI